MEVRPADLKLLRGTRLRLLFNLVSGAREKCVPGLFSLSNSNGGINIFPNLRRYKICA